MSKYLETRTDDGELPAFRPSGISCAEASDLIPALALGAIETGERHALRLHCQSCPACERVLQASERVAAYLPFAVPGLIPPERAKHALFARIADAQAATATAPPAFTSLAHIDTPVIDSPAEKRRAGADDAITSFPLGDPAITAAARPFTMFTSRMAKLAVGPLALAIMLVTLYSLQGVDIPFADTAVPTPTSEAAAAEAATTDTSRDSASAGESSTGAPLGDVTLVDTNSTLVETTLLNWDTQGASLAQPLLQQPSANTSGTFVYKAVSGGQTSPLGTIVPNFVDCSVTRNEAGSYVLTVSGVRLPGGTGVAGVYLVTYEGQRMYVDDLVINEYGDGKLIFETDMPFELFRTLEIGMARQGSAAASSSFFGDVTFSLSTNEVLRGLTPSS